MKTFKHFLFATALLLAVSNIQAQANAGVAISARIAPPLLPAYVQPPCPVDGYLWQPGYWAWDTDTQNYYWVPGVWMAPPEFGFLWTPPYWGFDGGLYVFHRGYWGSHVGFYGGINYGFGYGGVGFVGGRWAGNKFEYNTAVVNINRTVIHNTYVDKTVVKNNVRVNNRASFNGGKGGIQAKPNREENVAMKEGHRDITNDQQTHENNARADKNQSFANNHGRPMNMSMDRFNGNHFNAGGHMAGGRMGGGRH